ncbi:MAG: RNA polymerase factor sigma-54 [Acidobacteriota bacterium]
MALEQKLHLKLAQRLVMTPTLQQAIKLLQLSRLELEQALAQELQVNPLLEIAEEVPAEDEPASTEEAAGTDDSAGSEEASGPALAADTAAETQPTDEASSTADDSFSEVEVEALFANYLQDTSRVPATWEDEEEPPLENSPAPEASMFDALCAQLRLLPVPPELFPVCEFVIGNLDPDGYLRTPDDDLAAQLGLAPEVVADAVRTVQELEPPGIAARSLQECLSIQLERYSGDGGRADVAVAARIVDQGYDDFLHQRWDRLTQSLNLAREELRPALEVIRGLDSKPGLRLGPSNNSVVEPDVVVTKLEGAWRVTLNDEGFPRLRVSPQYQRLLQSRMTDSETSGYLRERMRAALWFLRSVEQRQNTVLRVAEAIVTRQSEFLDRGLAHLRPLVLRDIADDIGMHESTVSRVVSNKYMSTPRGVFPLKFFFHSAISHAVQGDISSVVVKDRIRQLIAEEDARKPLSDARVARQLNRLGIRIARRTVAKYREELAIPSSEQRRRALR